MTEIVDPAKIEGIVGVKRHETLHYARAVSAEKSVYILHSKHCFETTADLRDCIYSKSLDNGIDVEDWPVDEAVPVVINWNKVVPL